MGLKFITGSTCTEIANVDGQLNYVFSFFFFVLQLDDDVLTR